MKKLKNLIFVFIVMMFVSIINVDAAGVSIKSIRLIDHTGNATELSEPKINGLNINFDMAFGTQNDSATYEVILSNPTNKEYELNTDKKFGPSNYISYTYELKDKTNRIKANSDVTLNIIIKYEHTVPADKLVNGQYVESNDLGITLLNEDNPNTFNNVLLLLIILIVLIGITLIMIKSKRKNQLIVLIALLLVPVTVFALEKLKLTVSTKIVVGDMYNIYYEIQNPIKTSELNSNDYLYDVDTCRDIVVKEGDSEYVSYTQCWDLFKKDSKSYFEGQRVSINPFSYLTIKDPNRENCNRDYDTGTYECPNKISYNLTENELEVVCYLEDEIPTDVNLVTEYYSNVCTLNEFNNFNFTSVIYKNIKDGSGIINFNAPNEFTMPGHDIIIGIFSGK